MIMIMMIIRTLGPQRNARSELLNPTRLPDPPEYFKFGFIATGRSGTPVTILRVRFFRVSGRARTLLYLNKNNLRLQA